MSITHYINTDLDIYSSQDLNAIGDYLEELCCVLQCGWVDETFHLCLESNSDRAELNEHISQLLEVIEALPVDMLAALKARQVFDFNIGIETNQCWAKNFRVTSANLSRIAQLNASVSVTLYPYREDSVD